MNKHHINNLYLKDKDIADPRKIEDLQVLVLHKARIFNE
jgi:hypothetical protein